MRPGLGALLEGCFAGGMIDDSEIPVDMDLSGA